MLQMFVLALSLYNTRNRGVFLLCKITNLLIYSKQFNLDILPVSRKHCGDKILSKSVNYVIYLLSRDLNGQKAEKTVFAIVDEQHILLSDTICGYNGLEGQFGSSAMELEKAICGSFGIDKRNICVEQIEQFL